MLQSGAKKSLAGKPFKAFQLRYLRILFLQLKIHEFSALVKLNDAWYLPSSLTIRWCGRARDLGAEVEVICRRTTSPLD